MSRIVIAGGGIAGLEALAALRRHLGAEPTIELLEANAELVERPMSVAAPFGPVTPRRFDLARIVADHGATLRPDRLASVDPPARELRTVRGEILGYDALLVAVGARADVAVPGALTFTGPRDVDALRKLLDDLAARRVHAVAFAVPPGVTWALPLYELALMTAASVPSAEIVLVTPESAPLALFGPAGSDAVAAQLARAGIEFRPEATPQSFENGVLTLASGDTLAVDAVVAVPRLHVPPLPGVPQGEHGFIATDEFGRVDGLTDVYAAGDVTAFPVKQGGVAVRQAQAAATCIAADAGAPLRPEPFEPVLRDMMLTGAAPSYLESAAGESLSADSPLWWPPTKIADSYLVPYLLTRFQLAVAPAGERLVDIVSTGGEPVPARPARPTA
jgi:sulfide:quinone oxidoreductase